MECPPGQPGRARCQSGLLGAELLSLPGSPSDATGPFWRASFVRSRRPPVYYW
jgi:hypothetical protein